MSVSAPPLTLRSVVGISPHSPLVPLPPSSLAYIAGHQVSLFTPATKQQRLFSGTDNNSSTGPHELLTFSFSPNQRYLALSERGHGGRGYLSVVEIKTGKRKRIPPPPELRVREWSGCTFSDDSKILYTAGTVGAEGGANPSSSSSSSPSSLSYIIAWAWTKARPIGYTVINCSIPPVPSSSSSSLTSPPSPLHLSVDPLDPSHLLCYGWGYINQFKCLPSDIIDKQTGTEGLVGSASSSSSSSSSPDSSSVPSLQGLAQLEKSMRRGSVPAEERFTAHCRLSVPFPSSHHSSSSSSSSPASSSASNVLVVCSESGSVCLFHDNVCVHTMNIRDVPCPPHLSSLPSAIYSCCSVNQHSFVCACDSGILLTFNVEHSTSSSSSSSSFSSSSSLSSAPSLSVTLSRAHQFDASTRILRVCYLGESDRLVLLSDNQALSSLAPFAAEIIKPADIRLAPLFTQFPSGAITGMSACVRKPLFITTCADRTVRIYNYLERRCVLSTTFPELAYSVSLHPSGLHCVIGFIDKLRLCNILCDDIRSVREFPIKQCGEVEFSHGGHMFAAANGGLIQVYSTYTAEQIAVFRGHTGSVRSLYWSLDDSRIVSSGADGAVYERRFGYSGRSQEHVQKGCKFTSAIITADEGKIYACGDDQMLKEISDKNVNKTLDAGCVLTKLCITQPPQRALFAGTASGVVRSFAFPLTGVVKDYQAHSMTVTRIVISPFDDCLISASEDGTIAIFDIGPHAEDGGAGGPGAIDRITSTSSSVDWSSELLVTRSDLEEKNSQMYELRSSVDELTASNDYQLRLHEMSYTEKLKDVEDKYRLQLDHDRQKIELFREEKKELEEEMESKINQLKASHSAELQLIDVENQRVIMKAVARYQSLADSIEYEIKRNTIELENERRQHEQEIKQQESQAERLFLTETQLKEEEKQQTRMIQRESIETQSQIELDNDKEIEIITQKYESKLAIERDATLRLKGENGIIKKKFISLQKDIDEQRESIRAMSDKQQQLRDHIKLLQERISNHKSDIRDKDKVIGENEKSIFQLKKDNQELEKFKFVLDYQIKELKKEIEPRENEIQEQKEGVQQMDQQLEQYHKQNREIKGNINELQLKIEEKHNANQAARNYLRHQENRLKEAIALIATAAKQHIQHPQQLKQHIIQINQTFHHSPAAAAAALPSPSSPSSSSSPSPPLSLFL